MCPAAVHLRAPRLRLAPVSRAALPDLPQGLRPLRQTRERMWRWSLAPQLVSPTLPSACLRASPKLFECTKWRAICAA